ncbi:MAG: hypothetical protein K0S37_2583 [Microbacterium sp.]|jgi:hypothetical protein|nr:hypothetical protein [Microbacterium sp.]
MAYFIALALLALVSVVASVWLIRTDGYRPVPTDPERAARRRDAASPRRDRRRSREAEVTARAAGTPRPLRTSESTTHTAVAGEPAEVPAVAPAPASTPALSPSNTGARRAGEATTTDADDRVLVSHAAD